MKGHQGGESPEYRRVTKSGLDMPTEILRDRSPDRNPETDTRDVQSRTGGLSRRNRRRCQWDLTSVLQYVRERLREMEQSVCVERERGRGESKNERVRPKGKLQRHWKQHKRVRNRDRGGLPRPSSG